MAFMDILKVFWAFILENLDVIKFMLSLILKNQPLINSRAMTKREARESVVDQTVAHFGKLLDENYPESKAWELFGRIFWIVKLIGIDNAQKLMDYFDHWGDKVPHDTSSLMDWYLSHPDKQ